MACLSSQVVKLSFNMKQFGNYSCNGLKDGAERGVSVALTDISGVLSAHISGYI